MCIIMIISEEELNEKPIKENDEKLIDITKADSRINILIPKYLEKTKLKKVFVRETVAHKLKTVQNQLPENMNLVLTSGVRPLSIQKEIFDSFLAKYKDEHPDWTDKKAREETREIVSPPEESPPHSTGGAIDLNISKNGKPLDMGCEIPMEIDTKNPDISKFPTMTKNITKKQKENRKLLINIMTKNGFVNLESEWWHWSYGDRYWAVKKRKKFAIYSAVKNA